jgi:hypothetical protein
MQGCYIYAPYETQPIEYHKGKVKRIKRARKGDVPESYRKNIKAKIKRVLHEIAWQFSLLNWR